MDGLMTSRQQSGYAPVPACFLLEAHRKQKSYLAESTLEPVRTQIAPGLQNTHNS